MKKWLSPLTSGKQNFEYRTRFILLTFPLFEGAPRKRLKTFKPCSREIIEPSSANIAQKKSLLEVLKFFAIFLFKKKIERYWRKQAHQPIRSNQAITIRRIFPKKAFDNENGKRSLRRGLASSLYCEFLFKKSKSRCFPFLLFRLISYSAGLISNWYVFGKRRGVSNRITTLFRLRGLFIWLKDFIC